MHRYTAVSAGGPGGPSPEEVAAWSRRVQRPDNEIPGSVPLDVPLLRTDGLAVWLGVVEVYSTGLSFQLRVRLRDTGNAPLGHLLHGRPHLGAEPEDGLLLGFEYPDGRMVANVGFRPAPTRPGRPDDAPDDAPVLLPGEGGGGFRSYDGSYWLAPVPAGDLTVVCVWPARGLPEARSVIGAAELDEAAQRVVVLWPWQPDDPRQPGPPPRPQVPVGGWFERALGADAPDDPGAGGAPVDPRE